MIKIIDNFSSEPTFSISAKYLSTSKMIDPKNGSYTIPSSGKVLIKLLVSNFGNNDKVTKASLKLKIAQMTANSVFKLRETSSTIYNQNKATSITGTIVDSICYKGVASAYDYLSDVLEFDLTKFLYNKLPLSTQPIYFALESESEYVVRDIEALFKKESIIQMTLSKFTGLDTMYEYNQEDIGFAGVSSINLANGKMIHKVEAMQTRDETIPAAFHMFYNPDRTPTRRILGIKNWSFSGDYKITNDAKKGELKLEDPSEKTLVLTKCTSDDIKNVYDIDPIEPFEGDYYLCLSEMMYALVDKDAINHIVFVDKNKNKMTFKSISGYQVLESIELGSKKTVKFEYDTLGRPTKITSSTGDYLTVSYSGSYVSYVKSYNKKGVQLGKIEIVYESNKLTRMKSYVGSSTTVADESYFEYDSNNRLITIIDSNSGIGCKYQYDSSGRVVNVERLFVSDPDKQKYTKYDYKTLQTIVTDYTGFSTNYYFDYFGRCKSIIDCEGKSITRNYEEVVNGEAGNLTGESKLQVHERNVIENNSFDSADNIETSSAWKLVQGSSSDIKIVDGGVYGQRCLKINKKTSDIKITQDLSKVPAGTYSFKAFFKAIADSSSVLPVGAIKATINVSYTKTITTNISNGNSYGKNTASTTQEVPYSLDYVLSNDLGGTFDWSAFEKNNIVIPSGNISGLKVTLTISLTGSNYTAFVDDLSLSYGDHIVRHNFIKNGYFENGTSNWTLSKSSKITCVTVQDDDHQKVLGDNVLKIAPDIKNSESISQVIKMSGDAGEELLLSLFGKANCSKNDEFKAYVKIHYKDTGVTQTHEFEFEPNFESWQVLTRNIVAERAYDQVEVGVKARSKADVYVDAIQLYRDSFGKEYSYTEKKSLAEMSTPGGSCSNITYDEDNNVTEATDESGDTYRYSYDSKKNLTQITNNQNTRVLFSYNSNGKRTETKLISSTGEILKTQETFDDMDNSTSQTDDGGNTTSFEYDNLGRQTVRKDPNGLETSYKYNAVGLLEEQLAKFSGDKSKCKYTYDKHGLISTIETENGTKYSFSYTCDLQVATVQVDGKAFVSNQYCKAIDGINTNLLTKQILGTESNNGGIYTFEYDKKQRLTCVRFNGVEQVKYIYNERSQVCELVDCANGIHQYFSYDNEGNVSAMHDSDGNYFAYNYDNLQNRQKTTVKIGDILRSFDYEYKCEYNDYTPSGYFARLQAAFPDEVIKGGSGINGVYGGKASLNNLSTSVVNVSTNSALSDKVAYLSFTKGNAVVSYQIDSFNRERKLQSALGKNFYYSSWKSALNNTRTVFGWIKPCGSINGEQRIFAFATSQMAGIRFSLTVQKDGKICFKDLSANISLISEEPLKMGEWNLIGFEIKATSTEKEVSIVLNDEFKSTKYTNKTALDTLKHFIVGEPSKNISSGTGSDGNYSINNNTATNMQFKAAYISVGSTDIAKDDFDGIYSEGQKFLLAEPNFGASGVTYYNTDAYKGFDVITLNGSLSSLKRMMPKVHSYTEASFKVEKARMFKFDNSGLDPLYRHVYASYDSVKNLNKGNLSKLAYDLLLTNKGTITLRFKLDPASSNQDRVLLYTAQNTTQKLKLYVNTSNKLMLQQGSSGTKIEIGTIAVDKWHFVSLRWNGKSVQVNTDTTGKLITLTSELNMDGCLTYFGSQIDSAEKPTLHLNGCIEMIAFKETMATDAEVQGIAEYGESISVRTYYDELGRTSIKKIHTQSKVLSKKYEYAKNGTLTTTKISQETTFTGDSISYIRDSMDNLTSVIKKDATGKTLDTRTYKYDGLSRLKGSVINGKTHTYTYDTNNNIKSKDGVTYTYDSTIKDRLISRSDGTTITYDTKFIGNPTEIKTPGRTLSLTWFGRRLKSANDTSYTYDANGMRIGRTVKDQFNERYYLEGDRIAVLKRTQGSQVKTLTFVYDEANMLVGLSYNGGEYFYDRNINGEISQIINRAGKAVVTYDYDDWGKPTITSDGSTIGNELKELNPFMYKGYFFDQDTQMFYLKTRYYDPELGRFISADAEVGSVGNTMGMNLFAYCKCNPINLADENGNWPSWATKVCIGLAVIAVLAVATAVTVATGGAGACILTSMLVGAVKGALIGAVSGAITGAIMGAVTEGIKTGTWEGAWKGALSGAVEGAADGFMWGAIGGAISGAMNPQYCFVAGTMVLTSQGLKAIEKITIGDQVLAYNDNLGIFAYQDVVDTYINETEELCHIHTAHDEIVCTPQHSILTDNGWKQAGEITAVDKVRTVNGFETVISVNTEHLDEKIKVYNLNVLCYHTYVIGNNQVVVHNACDLKQGATKCVEYEYNGKIQKAYNTNGKDIFYSVDRAGHGGSAYKGFKLTKGNKYLEWVGDYTDDLVKIVGKHKGEATKLFKIIKFIPVK